jgi:two-component system LytT family response regulator
MPEVVAPLRCVIVDDNEINRLTLEHFVDLTPELTLAASLPGSMAALRYFRQGEPCDLLLLDVEMPELSGLELARLLPAPAPAIVMVTTHPDFAVDAFALAVTDYLVKPVELARFSQAVSRVLAQRSAPALTAPLPQTGGDATSDAELFVKVGSRLLRLNFDDVLYIEALSTYSVIVTKTQKHIVYLTLKAIAQRLPFAYFQRAHRSYIVNTRRIESIEDQMLTIGPYEIPLGKSYQEEFMRSLRNL